MLTTLVSADRAPIQLKMLLPTGVQQAERLRVAEFVFKHDRPPELGVDGDVEEEVAPGVLCLELRLDTV